MKERQPHGGIIKPNQQRHTENLMGREGVEGLTGFYHGRFWDKGVPRIPKEKLPMKGVIFER